MIINITLKYGMNALYLCRTHSLYKGGAEHVELSGVRDDANLGAGTALVRPAVLGAGL